MYYFKESTIQGFIVNLMIVRDPCSTIVVAI